MFGRGVACVAVSCVLTATSFLFVGPAPALADDPVTLTGTISDTSGAPLYTCVNLVSSLDSSSASDCYSESHPYSITVAPGEYSLSFTQFVAFSDITGGPYESSYHASLEVSASESLDLVVPAWFKETVRVTDPAGAAVPGAVLTFPSSSLNCSGPWTDTAAGLTGTFDSSWWTPGLTSDALGLIVVADSGCPVPVSFQIQPPVDSGLLVAQSSIPAGTTDGELTVVLTRPAISGTVTGPEGPLPGIQVSTDWGPGATTDSDGRYTINDLPVGSTYLNFVDPTGTYLQGCYNADSPGALDVTGSCGSVSTQTGSADIIMTKLATHIRGKILGPDGKPLAGVDISAFGDSGWGDSLTDADGLYDLSVAQGAYHLEIQVADSPFYCYDTDAANNVSPNGCPSASITATGVVTLPDIQLPALMHVSGHIVGADGITGIDGVMACLNSPAWTLWWGKGGQCGAFEGSSGGTPDGLGAYSLGALPGTYTLLFDNTSTGQIGCYVEGSSGPSFTLDLTACTPFTVSADRTGVDVEIPDPGQTPVSAGGSVTIAPVYTGDYANATLTFSDVTGSGVTSLDTGETGPAPVGFVIGDNPTYYEVSTTATFTGLVTICLNYDPSSFTDPAKVRLYHYDEAQSAWVDITTSTRSDALGSFICGQTSSFSPFAIGQKIQAPPAAQSITFDALPAVTFGADPVKLAASASSDLPVSYSTTGPCDVKDGTLSLTGAGTCVVTASQAGSDDWQAAAPVERSFLISPALLTVKADHAIKTYGSANPDFTYAITGFVGDDSVSVVSGLASLSTTAVTGSPVDSYPITVTAGDLRADNYSFTFVNSTLEIGKAPLTVTAPSPTRAYGADNPDFTPNYAGLVNGDGSSSLTTVPICTTPATKLSPVDAYPVTCSGGVADNYDISYVSGSLTVTTPSAPPTVPGKPTAVTATAGNLSASVAWTAPTDGGSTITGYTVTASDGTHTCPWTSGLLTCNVAGLTNGHAYTFTVTATNGAGTGPASDPSNSVTPIVPVYSGKTSTFHPVDPIRLLDTRAGNGLSGRLTVGVPRTFQITGRGGASNIPLGATAVTANVTVVHSTAAGSVYLGPAEIASPTTATINFNRNDVIASGATIAISSTGTMSATLTAASGTTDLLLDVTGYFSPDASGDTYHTMTPVRLLDTRIGNGLKKAKLKAKAPVTFTVRGRGGVPSNAVAVTGNLTVTNATATWAVYIGPSALKSPATSTINFVKGQTRANSLTVALSSKGTLSATYLASGGATTDLVFDVTGFYTADQSGAKFVPLTTPTYVLDTRSGIGSLGKLVAYTPRTFPVRGLTVPANATAISGIMSVYNQTSTWAVFVGPYAVTKPTTSALNFVRTDNCSNGFTVALNPSDGSLSVTYMSGAGNTTNVVIVATGYFVP
jgi:hypothetical protein